MKQKDKYQHTQTDLIEYFEPKWITSPDMIFNKRVKKLEVKK